MDSDGSSASGAGPGGREPGEMEPTMDSPSRPVPWAEEESLDPIQDAVRGLARQPTFTGEKELGKWRAGARFFRRCCIIGFVGSLFPLGVVVDEAIHCHSAGDGLQSPWWKLGTALFTLTLGTLVVRNSLQVRRTS